MTEEDRLRIFSRDSYTCQECGATPGVGGLQIAHRIRQGKGKKNGTVKWIKSELFQRTLFIYSDKWIKKNIIDHPDNLVTTCSLKCNAKMNIFFNPVKRDKLLNQIIKKVLEGAA